MQASGAKRQWVVAALVATMLVAPLPALARHQARPSPPPTLPAPAATARIPAALLPRINASFAADDPAYAIATLPDDATMLRASNPAHRLTTTFAPDGLTFAGRGEARWTLRLAGIGEETVAPGVVPVIAGQRVEYRRGNMTEWYLNGPLGVEQGFTLAAPPMSGDALTLIVATGGNATPRLDGGDVTLTLPDGGEWAYGHLQVTDATGRELPARLEAAGGTIAIRANLAGAVYPVTVDPFVQQKRLTASDGAASDYFGSSVAISGDGSRIVVGASSKSMGTNTNQGEAYVYSGTNYATETKLTASDGAIYDNFGGAVAISADGSRVVVGAGSKTVGQNAAQGATYIYSGTNYATEQRLIANDGAASDYFGSSVAISGDGTRVTVGAYGKNMGANFQQGAAYIYSGTNNATETKLIASDGAYNDRFGWAVAISGDGTRVAVGADGKNMGGSNKGAAYVYTPGPGGTYATETKLTDSDGAAGDNFGHAVAISGDGTRIVVGAVSKTVGTNTAQGAAYVYGGVNYGTETKLTASDGATNDYFGVAVGISRDGTSVIVGAYLKKVGANANQGAAYVYSGTNNATETKLIASDGAAGDHFGAVAISGDNTRVVVGAYLKTVGANTWQGATYIFAAPLGVPNPLPPPRPGPAPVGQPAPLPPQLRPTVPVNGVPNPLPPRRP